MTALPPPTPSAPPRWWTHRPTLQRVLSDLLAGELAAMRPGLARRPLPWPATLELVSELGADSLELLGMASAMEQALGIGRIGEERLLADARLGSWLDAAAAGLAHGNGIIGFRTSGSSGAPKNCFHALASLWQEALELAVLFPATGRILSLVPAHHIYGFLFTVLLPRALGLDPDAVSDLRGNSAGMVARQLAPGDLVVGFPDFWRAFVPLAGTPPPRVSGVSSTAPCPDEVARSVTACGVARLVQVYGSSETAGVGWREHPDEDYRLFSFWSRAEGAPGKPVRDADAGGSTLTRYWPDGSHSACPLQDILTWSAPHRFRPAGRIDHAVQVGGTNVFPAYVADVLRMHPQVAQASVRLMRPDEGLRLKAFVVPRDGATLATLRAELDTWIAMRLSTPERPAAYTFGAALPRQAGGKLSDWIIDNTA